MSRYSFVIRNISVCATEAFSEARTDELKLLLALMELEGKSFEVDDLSELSGISVARCHSGIAFWQEAGVIAPADIGEYGSVLTEEFDGREDDSLLAQSTKEIAAEIRDKSLADLMVMLAELAEKPVLSPSEVSKVTALTAKYGLSADYIAELASYMKEKSGSKGGFSVFRLCTRAVRLSEEGIDTAEELEIHIKNERTYMEIRIICGIYDRALSEKEKESFAKWCGEYGYSSAIIKHAYDKCVETKGKYIRAYMDAILSGWHAAGCKTVEDCDLADERFKAQSHPAQGDASQETPAPSPRRKPRSNAPKFGDIDPEDALKKALSRSFWDKKGK